MRKIGLLLIVCVLLLGCVPFTHALAQQGTVRYESDVTASNASYVKAVDYNNAMAWVWKTNRNSAKISLHSMYRYDIKQDAPQGKTYYGWADVYSDQQWDSNPRTVFTRATSNTGNDNRVYNNKATASVPYLSGQNVEGYFSLVMRVPSSYSSYGKIRLRGYFSPC